MVYCHFKMHLCDLEPVVERIYEATAAPARLPFGKISAISVRMHQQKRQPPPSAVAGQTHLSSARTRSQSSCQGIRAGCSSDAARWRCGRIKDHRPTGRRAAELPGDRRPVRDRGACNLSLGSGYSSHGVKARSSTDCYQPWPVWHRLASEGKRNRWTEYVPWRSKQV